jgi:hypothetical protein
MTGRKGTKMNTNKIATAQYEMNGISIEQIGRRHYVRGNTYPIKDELRSRGCRWDAGAKAWWTGKADVAAEIVATIVAPPAAPRPEIKPGETFVAVDGNTYPVKDQLRAMGGRWDGGAKVWMVPSSQAGAAKALVDAQPAKRAGNGYRRGYSARGGHSGGGAYCYGRCPVGGFRCCAENGPCHDCE